MQLRKSKTLGVLDHHDGGCGNIDADLDHGGCHEKADLACGELRHYAIFFRALHLAVHETDTVAETLPQALKPFCGVAEMLDALCLRFLDQRADPVDELAGR